MKDRKIERKFLVNKIPKNNLVEEFSLIQGYISMNPEVRISKCITIGKNYRVSVFNTVTIKGDGDLAREEISFNVSNNTFTRLANFIDNKFIFKIGQSNLIKDYHISSATVYINSKELIKYSEVEFDNISVAKKFKWPIKTIKANDITYDADYKMKNIWKYNHDKINNNHPYYTAFYQDLMKTVKRLSENRSIEGNYIKPILRESIDELVKQYKMYGIVVNKTEWGN